MWPPIKFTFKYWMQSYASHNIWFNGGLVNGSIGTVTTILYDEGISPPDLPHYIMVAFDSFNGLFVYGKEFPVIPIIRTWDCKGVLRTRKQFPLSLAYAVTNLAFTNHKD